MCGAAFAAAQAKSRNQKETKKAAENLFLLLGTSVALCFLPGQAVGTEQQSCHVAQWEGRPCPAPRSELLCVRAFQFPDCALLAALTGAPCVAFPVRAEVQAGCSWAAAAPVLHSLSHPAWLYSWHTADRQRPWNRELSFVFCVPSAPSSARLPLLKLQGCTGSLISTAAPIE